MTTDSIRLRLECDYAEGAHPRVLERLAETNLLQTPGYGEDEFCDKARSQIRALCQNQTLAVHFLVGGTQTNAALITAALRPYQGVIAAETGHIATHETGAIEASGHKVLTLPSDDGKLTAQGVEALALAHWNDPTHEHIVQPGMVYLSQPTENGTLYTKEELTALWQVCQAQHLFLYIDGARLGYGLMSEGCDLTLPELSRLCDAFTIGGTKQGLLFGEALVLSNPALSRDFRYLMKQRGGLLAKGRLLGVQFCAILEEELYFSLSRHAVRQAMRLRRVLEELDIPLLYDSPTNQQFPILPDDLLARLEEEFAFSFWCKPDPHHTAVRICTCWATQEETIDRLIARLRALSCGDRVQ